MNIYYASNEGDISLQSTSKGNQRKWVIGNKFLKADTMGYESIAEVLASELEMVVDGIDFVNYSLCKVIENGKVFFACESDVFLSGGDRLVSLERILSRYAGSEVKRDILFKGLTGKNLVSKVVKICSDMTNLSEESIMMYLSNMIKLDAILLNEDRHTNNIAFIKGKEGYRLAPIFDNGLSLLSDLDCYPMGANISMLIRKVKSKPFSTDFKKQLGYFSSLPLLRIDYERLLFRLNEYTVEFKEKEYFRAKSVLLKMLNNLKGEAWNNV